MHDSLWVSVLTRPCLKSLERQTIETWTEETPRLNGIIQAYLDELTDKRD